MPVKATPLPDRFWPKVLKTETCWLWTAGKTRAGYGHISGGPRGKMLYAHRISWEWVNGPIPPGVEIDHRCSNPACVNPDHLRAVTSGQNSQHLATARRGAKSGRRGVSWDKANGKWRVIVQVGGKKYTAGRFADLDDADRAARELRDRLMTHHDPSYG